MHRSTYYISLIVSDTFTVIKVKTKLRLNMLLKDFTASGFPKQKLTKLIMSYWLSAQFIANVTK